MGTGEMTLSLGPPGGTRVEFAARTTAADVAAASALARDGSVAWTAGDGGELSIVGRGEQGTLRLIRRPDHRQSLVDELRGLEEHEAGRRGDRGLAAIFAALLSAERGLAQGSERIEGPPAFFAELAEGREAGRGEAWRESDLDDKVLGCIDELVTGRTLWRPAAGPLDSARFWLRMGEHLWDAEVRQRLGKVPLEATNRRLLAMLAGSWMELKPEGWVWVAGCGFLQH